MGFQFLFPIVEVAPGRRGEEFFVRLDEGIPIGKASTADAAARSDTYAGSAAVSRAWVAAPL